MRYQPLHDRLIVESIDESKRTPGGIYIPDAHTSQKHVAFGTVIAVGTGRVNAEGKVVPLIVKEGDTVAFPRKAPGLIPVFDDEGNETIVLMLREAEVIAIVHDMPRATSILDVTGAPLSMLPLSRGKPDSAYESDEQLEVARRAGWDETDVHIDEPA